VPVKKKIASYKKIRRSPTSENSPIADIRKFAELQEILPIADIKTTNCKSVPFYPHHNRHKEALTL
jgi:hypothetical protein